MAVVLTILKLIVVESYRHGNGTQSHSKNKQCNKNVDKKRYLFHDRPQFRKYSTIQKCTRLDVFLFVCFSFLFFSEDVMTGVEISIATCNGVFVHYINSDQISSYPVGQHVGLLLLVTGPPHKCSP